MNDNKVIAQYLFDLAKESKSEFIEISEDSELIDIAKKMNLVIPSPDIAILKTVYAQTDIPNRNHIVLPKEAVKKALPTLIGKQANWSHKGANYICGWILDSKLEKDLIIIYVAIFKSLFIEEFDTVKQMFEDNRLSVSFEIWNKNSETGESVLHDLGHGNRSIDPILFHGVGILIGDGEKPACPKAYAKKLLAMFNINNLTEETKDNIKEEYLVFASLVTEEPQCKNCTTCTCDQEKEVKIVEEIVKIDEEAKERLCPECNQPLKDEDKELCAECLKKKEKSQEIPERVQVTEPALLEQKPDEQTQVMEQPVEEKKGEIVIEEKKEEALIVTTIQEVTKVDEIKPEGEIITTVVKTEEVVVSDEGKEIKKVEEEIKTVVTYTTEQLMEKVQEAKVELQKVIEEKDKEITQLKQELGTKDQEIAELKNPKVEEKKEKEMTVGAVECEKESGIKTRIKNINEIIANKGK